MRIRDWSSDVCSSYLVDLIGPQPLGALVAARDQIFAAAADIAVRAGPHIPPRLGRDYQFVAVRGEIGREDSAEILLRRAVWRAVIVGEIDMRDAAIERAAQHRAAGFEHVRAAEILPPAKRQPGESTPPA